MINHFSADFGKTAGEYRQYRHGFPPDLFVRLKNLGIGLAGQDIIDFGTGTGTLAAQFTRQGCHVIGVDIAQTMLDQARILSEKENLQIIYHQSAAERTNLPSQSTDIVSAGQCWHWFNGHAAAQEAYRLLRRNGQLVICHVDWLPLPNTIVEKTESLILKYNPKWPFAKGTGFYGQWAEHLFQTGFVGIESFSFDVCFTFTKESWRGRIRASGGVAASLSPDQVLLFDSEHQDLLKKHAPQELLEIPHRVFVIIGRKIAQ